MPSKLNIAIASVIGIDIGKNSFHVVGQDQRGAIVLRQKWSRGQVEARLANLPPCLIGMEACVGASWPTASSVVYPKTRSAPLFQLVIAPSRFLLTMAASLDST